jgi:hypothetical protein
MSASCMCLVSRSVGNTTGPGYASIRKKLAKGGQLTYLPLVLGNGERRAAMSKLATWRAYSHEPAERARGGRSRGVRTGPGKEEGERTAGVLKRRPHIPIRQGGGGGWGGGGVLDERTWQRTDCGVVVG